MANEEQLSILKQGVQAWNEWRQMHPTDEIDLRHADLDDINLNEANLNEVNLTEASLRRASFIGAYLMKANLNLADFGKASLFSAHLYGADLRHADLHAADLRFADLRRADMTHAFLGYTALGGIDLSMTLGLEHIQHDLPSSVDTSTIQKSKGQVPEAFLRGCGFSDTDIEYAKLANPGLSNEDINKILYRMYDLRAMQALQISPLFISYSHGDSTFVDKIETSLTQKGVRFWRDIHNLQSGRIEKQIDKAISQNPTVLLVLSEQSLSSDWVEHEVRTARGLEKDLGRDVLCPVALDDSWKSSRWPKRIMEQIMEYNILDFSEWRDDVKFDVMFRKLIDGLELFYKG